MARLVLEWLPAKDAVFPLARAVRHLASKGFRGWSVGKAIRESPMFSATDYDVSLPEGFQQTAFRISNEGQEAWERVHADARRRPRPQRSDRPPADAGPSRAPRGRRAAAAGAEQVTSLAGFGRSSKNVREVRTTIRELSGTGWVLSDDLYPALRKAFGWGENIGKGMISSALGMLAAMGDIERRKRRGQWEYCLGT